MSPGDEPFIEMLTDMLAPLGGIRVKRMFGGHGFYRFNRFFAIAYQGAIHFKTDDMTRHAYIERGMEPFTPNPGQTLKNYYQVPDDVVDDPEMLREWAISAMDAAGRQG